MYITQNENERKSSFDGNKNAVNDKQCDIHEERDKKKFECTENKIE